MSSGNQSDDELTMLEDICDGSQSHPGINGIEACYKIFYRIKRGQVEWKVALLSTQKMDKGFHKVFKAAVNEILQVFPSFCESGSEVYYFIPEPRNFEEVTRL